MFLPTNAYVGEEHRPFTYEGRRGAVLLIHGFPGTANDLRPLADELHAAGWTTDAILLPGFGPEINDLPGKTVGDWRNAVSARLGLLRSRHECVYVVGHSLGGALAISAVADQPIDGLVLLAPFHRINHVLWRLLPAIQIIVPQFKPFRLFKPDFDDPEFRRGVLRMAPGTDLDNAEHRAAVLNFTVPVRVIARVRTAGEDAFADARSVRVPTLVVQGHDDPLVVPANTRLLASRLGGAMQYVEVPGDHDLHSRDKASWPYVRDAVVRFIDSHESEGMPA